MFSIRCPLKSIHYAVSSSAKGRVTCNQNELVKEKLRLTTLRGNIHRKNFKVLYCFQDISFQRLNDSEVTVIAYAQEMVWRLAKILLFSTQCESSLHHLPEGSNYCE